MYRNIRLTDKSKEKLDLLMVTKSYKSISDCVIHLCDYFVNKKDGDIDLEFKIKRAEEKYNTIFKAKEQLQIDYFILLKKTNELK